jgi:hypothetical protein
MVWNLAESSVGGEKRWGSPQGQFMNCSCEVRKEAGLKADGESRLLVGATRRVAPTEIRKKFGLIGDQALLFEVG